MNATLKLLENLAGLIAITLLLAFATDWAAAGIGYQTSVFCWALWPILKVTFAAGYCITILGVILWTFSFFRSETALFLGLGGGMLAFLPPVLPQYLGVTCHLANP